MTTTIELSKKATVLAKMHQGQMNDDLREIAQRLRELDEQVKQQTNDYGRGMAVADLALKPDCVWVKLPCGRDSKGNDINSYEPSCIIVHTDEPLPMKLTKFCHLCSRKVKEST